MNDSAHHPQPFSLLIRLAVLLAVAALGCILVFLANGFSPWTLGVGAVLGVPLLIAAMTLYLVRVVLDLRRKGDL